MIDSDGKQVFWFKKSITGAIYVFEKPYGDARNNVSFKNVTEVEGVPETKLMIKKLKELGITVKQNSITPYFWR